MNEHQTKRLLTSFLLVAICGAGPLHAQAQVEGQVTDGETQETIPGASVLVKGTTIGTTTGTDGRYEIEVPNPSSDTLVFSFVGYEAQEIPVEGQGEIDVVLSPEAVEAEEVVVVGYGEQEKASVVGAIESIDAEEINQSPTTNLNVAMAGRLPGLSVLQRSGEPGRKEIRTYIRGRSTTNDQEPLVLVDGVERPSYASLDPATIESISILKDASATAVYGVRGANGVILITTKRGEAGERKITLTAETALKNFTRFPDLVNSAEYAHLRNETRTNAGQDRQFTEQEIEYFRTGEKPLLYPDRNFVEEFTKNFARQQDYNLKISGGGNFARYFVNAGFVSQNSLIKTDENDPKSPWNEEMRLRRFSFRSNIDIDVNESLRARLNLAGNLGKQRSPVAQKGEPASSASGLILDDIIRLPPNLIPKDVTPEDAIPEGEVIFSPEAKGKPVYGAINRSGYNVANRNRIMATFGLKQEMDFITEGLSAEARLSFDTRNISTQSRQRDYASYQVVGETTANGQDSVAYRRIGQTENTPLGNNLFSTARKTTDLNISLNYEHTLGANHDVTGLLLYNQVRRTIDAELPFNHIGFVGRATYGYDNRYLAEFNFGYNGSEQFAPGRRFGLFPSFAVGWVPTQEEFLEDSDVLSYLKLRGSYGIVGNDRLGAERFLYLADYGKGGGSVGGLNNTIVESSLPNRNLTWERAHKYNLGVESEFFGSLGLDVDLFYERRNNILTRPNSVPTEFLGTTGIPPLNLGVIENKGLEATLSFSHSFNPEVHLQARVNGAFARNRYLEFDEPPLPEDYAYQRRREGFRIGERFGLKALGFFTSEEEIENHAEYQLGGTPPRVGDLKYKDANGDGLINQEDRVPIGNPKAPELTYGASFSLDYHQFDISFLLQGAGNQSQYLSGRGIWEVGAYNYTERHLKRFTKERYEAGKEILYPRLSYIQNSNHKYNSYWLRNSTFLRLKNAEIGYTLPSSLTSKIGSENIRIYVSGLNLLTWDMLPTDHYDPELADGAGNVHPLYRTYNFGARLTF